MAASALELWRLRRKAALLSALGAALALLYTLPVAAQGPAEIVLDAASSEVDYRSNTVLFRDLVITQGTSRVVAERARSTGLDFVDSTWTLSGGVRIEVEGGTLQSSEATVTFRRNRIAAATVSGEATRFEQRLKNGQLAEGKARQISYDAASESVTLQGSAALSDGRNDIRGERLIYDLAAQRVSAGSTSGSEERVRITIRPQPTQPEEAPSP